MLQIVVPAPEEYDMEKAKVLKRKGDEAFVKGQFPAAVEHYTGALRHNTSDHALWANRSAAAFRTGAFQGALLDARRARTIDPRYAKVSRLTIFAHEWRLISYFGGFCTMLSA